MAACAKRKKKSTPTSVPTRPTLLLSPYHATPRHATPRHATPRHATPCHAMPCTHARTSTHEHARTHARHGPCIVGVEVAEVVLVDDLAPLHVVHLPPMRACMRGPVCAHTRSAHLALCSHVDRHLVRHVDRHGDRHVNRHVHRHVDRHVDRNADRHVDSESGILSLAACRQFVARPGRNYSG